MNVKIKIQHINSQKSFFVIAKKFISLSTGNDKKPILSSPKHI